MSEVINKTQYLDLVGLKKYDSLIKLFIEKGDKDLADQIASLAAKIGNLDIEGSDDKTLAEIVDGIYESIKSLGEKDAELEEDIKGIIGEVSESVTLLTLSEVSSKLKDLETANIVNRVTTLEGVIDDLKNLGGENGLVAVVDKVNANMTAIETLNGEGEGSVKKAAAAAQAAAEAYADSLAGNYDAAGTAAGLNAAMDTRMTDVEGDVAALKAIDHDKLVADAIAAVVAGAESEFDTLKEVAEWIASDTLGSAALQTSVSKNTDNLETLMGTGVGSVAEAKSAADAAAQSAATNATAITDLEKKVDDDIANLTTHILEAASALAEVDGRLDALEEITAIDTSDIEGLFAPTQE